VRTNDFPFEAETIADSTVSNPSGDGDPLQCLPTTPTTAGATWGALEPETGPATRDDFRSLIEGPARSSASTASGVGAVVGRLIAIADGGQTALVMYPGQPGVQALTARRVVDLHGDHVGKSVLILFDSGDPERPIVMGVLRDEEAWPLDQRPGSVSVDADGQRMVVSARQSLVLRCGRASITLDRDGRVTIEGTHVVSHAEGVNRIRGGSVQLN
jgi:hypothetical protein